MNVLNKLVTKSLKLNTKRTIGTIIGIVLSVALICAVSSMVSSFRQTLVENAINESGYYHIELLNINDNDINKLKLNKDIKDINLVYKLGYSSIEIDSTFPYIEIASMDKDTLSNLSYELIEGRYPENDNEIVISNKIKLKGKYKVGDVINLNVGDRVDGEGYPLYNSNPYLEENAEEIINSSLKSYKIVGIVYKESVDNENYGITTNTTSKKLDAYISLKKPYDYEKSICELLGASSYDEIGTDKKFNYDYQINNELLRWEALKFSDSTFSMLMTIAGVVIFIIIFTSAFCIRNSFAISTTEKMKMYGMLASIGATKKQIKKSVLYEGFILGMIAIPLGILCGLLAVFILIKIVNILLGDFLFNSIDGIVFKVSILSIIISIVLGFITIYFSVINSAKKASKVSPIDNLRSSNDIKIDAKKLHTPKIIKKVFKEGGVLAYKNLCRSKKKYRTTVISLTVSIFVFITMFTFINEGFKQSSNYYTNYDYNLIVSLGPDYSDTQVEEIASLDSVDKSFYLSTTESTLMIKDLSMVNIFDNDTDFIKDEEGQYIGPEVLLLDDKTFNSYVKKINGNYDDLKDKGILIDNYSFYFKKKGDKKAKYYEERRYKYQDGDVIDSKFANGDNLKVEIGKVTTIRPHGLENTYYDGGFLILNAKYFSNINYFPYKLLISASDNEKVIKDIESINSDLYVFDISKLASQEKSMILVISIFLYGFITVITLIGTTNIFNTITSNMELRQKEFAMLKSVGMTKKEFNRMINLETLFYSTKALIYGTILGIIGSYAVHKSFSKMYETAYVIPYKAIIICIIFVFIIVYIIMRYSINKINKQNTIETIRKDNI